MRKISENMEIFTRELESKNGSKQKVWKRNISLNRNSVDAQMR